MLDLGEFSLIFRRYSVLGLAIIDLANIEGACDVGVSVYRADPLPIWLEPFCLCIGMY